MDIGLRHQPPTQRHNSEQVVDIFMKTLGLDKSAILGEFKVRTTQYAKL